MSSVAIQNPTYTPPAGLTRFDENGYLMVKIEDIWYYAVFHHDIRDILIELDNPEGKAYDPPMEYKKQVPGRDDDILSYHPNFDGHKKDDRSTWPREMKQLFPGDEDFESPIMEVFTLNTFIVINDRGLPFFRRREMPLVFPRDISGIKFQFELATRYSSNATRMEFNDRRLFMPGLIIHKSGCTAQGCAATCHRLFEREDDHADTVAQSRWRESMGLHSWNENNEAQKRKAFLYNSLSAVDQAAYCNHGTVENSQLMSQKQRHQLDYIQMQGNIERCRGTKKKTTTAEERHYQKEERKRKHKEWYKQKHGEEMPDIDALTDTTNLPDNSSTNKKTLEKTKRENNKRKLGGDDEIDPLRKRPKFKHIDEVIKCIKEGKLSNDWTHYDVGAIANSNLHARVGVFYQLPPPQPRVTVANNHQQVVTSPAASPTTSSRSRSSRASSSSRPRGARHIATRSRAQPTVQSQPNFFPEQEGFAWVNPFSGQSRENLLQFSQGSTQRPSGMVSERPSWSNSRPDDDGVRHRELHQELVQLVRVFGGANVHERFRQGELSVDVSWEDVESAISDAAGTQNEPNSYPFNGMGYHPTADENTSQPAGSTSILPIDPRLLEQDARPSERQVAALPMPCSPDQPARSNADSTRQAYRSAPATTHPSEAVMHPSHAVENTSQPDEETDYPAIAPYLLEEASLLDALRDRTRPVYPREQLDGIIASGSGRKFHSARAMRSQNHHHYTHAPPRSSAEQHYLPDNLSVPNTLHEDHFPDNLAASTAGEVDGPQGAQANHLPAAPQGETQRYIELRNHRARTAALLDSSDSSDPCSNQPMEYHYDNENDRNAFLEHGFTLSTSVSRASAPSVPATTVATTTAPPSRPRTPESQHLLWALQESPSQF